MDVTVIERLDVCGVRRWDRPYLRPYRSVFASEEVRQFLDGKPVGLLHPTAAHLRQAWLCHDKLRLLVHKWNQGSRMGVVEVKPLHSTGFDSYVWELRILAPGPGIRVFGVFAERNVFVALRGPFWRDELDDTRGAWRNRIEGTTRDWDAAVDNNQRSLRLPSASVTLLTTDDKKLGLDQCKEKWRAMNLFWDNPHV